MGVEEMGEVASGWAGAWIHVGFPLVSAVSKRKTSLYLPQSSTGRENEKRGECVPRRLVGSGGGTVLG